MPKPLFIHLSGAIKTSDNPTPWGEDIDSADYIKQWATTLLAIACQQATKDSPVIFLWDGDKLHDKSPDFAGILHALCHRTQLLTNPHLLLLPLLKTKHLDGSLPPSETVAALDKTFNAAEADIARTLKQKVAAAIKLTHEISPNTRLHFLNPRHESLEGSEYYKKYAGLTEDKTPMAASTCLFDFYDLVADKKIALIELCINLRIGNNTKAGLAALAYWQQHRAPKNVRIPLIQESSASAAAFACRHHFPSVRKAPPQPQRLIGGGSQHTEQKTDEGSDTSAKPVSSLK